MTLWRRLRRLGALAPVSGTHLLPANEHCREGFQWLAQEIRQAGGEALVMHVDAFEGLGDQQLIALFQTARNADYEELEHEVEALERELGGDQSPEEPVRLQDSLARLRRRHTEIARIDYFEAPAGARVAGRLAALSRALAAPILTDLPVPRVSPADYRHVRWVTRPRPHVDRLACAWLIRRFISPRALIRYALEPEPGEMPFDFEGAEFGHQGNRCSFETMIEAFGFEHQALRIIAEIVHEIDLHDAVAIRPETSGVELLLQGWQLLELSDEEREARGLALFDGLYAAVAPADRPPAKPAA